MIVAPYLGAWIETNIDEVKPLFGSESHHTWVRGLKPPLTRIAQVIAPVAPYLGAWIETKQRGPDLRSKPLCFFIILVIDIPF